MAGSVLAARVPESRELLKSYEADSFNRVEIALPPDTILRVRTSPEPILTISGTVTMEFSESVPDEKIAKILEGIGLIGKLDGRRLLIVEHREPEARTGLAKWSDADFDVTITVPEWTNVEVRQRNGRVDVEGDLGSVKVGLTSGQIDVSVPKERVRQLSARTRVGEVKADLGNITEEREGFFPGEMQYENVDGSTWIELALTFGDISVELRE